MRYLALLLVSLLLASCVGLKRGSGAGSPSLVKTFMREDGNTMYFAGPVYFDQVNGKGMLTIDYTYIHAKDESGWEELVTTNFTFEHPEQDSFNPTKMIWQSAEGEKVESIGFDEFFKEKKQKVYRYRYSTSLKKADWVRFMESESSMIVLEGMQFEPGKKYKNHRQQILDEVVFAIK